MSDTMFQQSNQAPQFRKYNLHSLNRLKRNHTTSSSNFLSTNGVSENVHYQQDTKILRLSTRQSQTSASSPTDEFSALRKSNKPLMERRRRQRINKSLDELKALIIDPHTKESFAYGKLEKADILEMAVKFVRQLMHVSSFIQQRENAVQMNSFLDGFRSCEHLLVTDIARLYQHDSHFSTRLMAQLRGERDKAAVNYFHTLLQAKIRPVTTPTSSASTADGTPSLTSQQLPLKQQCQTLQHVSGPICKPTPLFSNQCYFEEETSHRRHVLKSSPISSTNSIDSNFSPNTPLTKNCNFLRSSPFCVPSTFEGRSYQSLDLSATSMGDTETLTRKEETSSEDMQNSEEIIEVENRENVFENHLRKSSQMEINTSSIHPLESADMGKFWSSSSMSDKSFAAFQCSTSSFDESEGDVWRPW